MQGSFSKTHMIMNRLTRFWYSVVLPSGSFVFYWAAIGRGNLGGGGSPYSGTATDLILGALVTIILIIALWLYFPLSRKIERFSPAWSFGITCGTGFFFIGLMMDNIGGYAWGAYAWFFFLWIMADFVCMPNDRGREQRFKVSFFKRVRLIEEGSAQPDKAEA